jgi:hypothetical protein
MPMEAATSTPTASAKQKKHARSARLTRPKPLPRAIDVVTGFRLARHQRSRHGNQGAQSLLSDSSPALLTPTDGALQKEGLFTLEISR